MVLKLSLQDAVHWSTFPAPLRNNVNYEELNHEVGNKC